MRHRTFRHGLQTGVVEIVVILHKWPEWREGALAKRVQERRETD